VRRLPKPAIKDYIACIPDDNKGMLDKQLDFDRGGVDLHLGEIAHNMVDWETLAPRLGLTDVEISDIKQNNNTNLTRHLQRCACIDRVYML